VAFTTFRLLPLQVAKGEEAFAWEAQTRSARTLNSEKGQKVIQPLIWSQVKGCSTYCNDLPP
jgi:hypothetical protein